MAYIYRVGLYKHPETISIPGGTYVADISNFETNYKSQTLKIDTIIIAETTFEINKSYTDFKDLIDGVTITWADVKHLESDSSYILILQTSAPL